MLYAIINTTDKSNVDFDEVVQNENTVRYSLDGLKFVIKYESTPTFITNGTVVPDSILNHSDCLTLMNTSDWSQNIE